eukprot:COSAG01_NODE_7928_length_2988_cov_102.404292_3_plen_111_part_00
MGVCVPTEITKSNPCRPAAAVPQQSCSPAAPAAICLFALARLGHVPCAAAEVDNGAVVEAAPASTSAVVEALEGLDVDTVYRSVLRGNPEGTCTHSHGRAGAGGEQRGVG